MKKPGSYTSLIAGEPAQPDEKEWRFVDELKAPLWSRHDWERRRSRGPEASLQEGVTIKPGFSDPEKVLDTAYEDLRDFLKAGKVALEGSFKIETAKIKTDIPETYRVETSKDRCRILAGDTEGIRRGIFYIEDEMLRSCGPFLPIGTKKRTPVIKTRISRCFFGPIKRPPKNRDELADDINYYPDNYLNRLAHDGINGLWLTISFSDLCPSRFFPDFGRQAQPRLEKLRRTVKHCARYGIKIYAFCIEPRGFGQEAKGEWLTSEKHLKKNPQLAGHRGDETVYFCTGTPEGQEYLEEATYSLFSSVPGLGGLIDITLGERPTNCYSGLHDYGLNNCPRCAKRKPWQVFAEMLSAMERGIHRAAPKAELISWLYTPRVNATPGSSIAHKKQAIREIAEHMPKNVTVQINFESSGIGQQLGRKHTVADYSLAYIGPSRLFRESAKGAVKNKAGVSAKLQVGCSHEIATVPFIPVPGNLYKKYKVMRELGVSSAMQCWYFGNYPSIMTKAAGELSFAPLPKSEDEFLLRMARIYWGKNAPTVVKAWKYFQRAYWNFPINITFAWYGPVHDAVVWPLHLRPVDEPIAPSWLLGFAPSGDRIGECICFDHTLDETLMLCQRMTDNWEKGVNLLQTIRGEYLTRSERERDIDVARALGLQFRSAFNVLKFYVLREELFLYKKPARIETLAAMRLIVKDEIKNSRLLAGLAESDSRLGFHSEAEGYKYFPAKLKWRIRLLEHLLCNDFPDAEEKIHKNQPLFPAYTGLKPEGAVYTCKKLKPGRKRKMDKISWDRIAREYCPETSGPKTGKKEGLWQTSWQAGHDGNRLYILVTCRTPAKILCSYQRQMDLSRNDHVLLSIEGRRLWPAQAFLADSFGSKLHQNKSSTPDHTWDVTVSTEQAGWKAYFQIPFKCIREDCHDSSPMRINVERRIPGRKTLVWLKQRPLRHRLVFGTDNPADYGWLKFE